MVKIKGNLKLSATYYNTNLGKLITTKLVVLMASMLRKVKAINWNLYIYLYIK